MANDCLVTKLKGTVNNPNLLKLGQCVITTEGAYFPEVYANMFEYISGKNVTITPKRGTCYAARVIDKGNLPEPITGPTLIETPNKFSVYLPDGGEFILDDYYTSITSCVVDHGGIDVSIFNYLQNFNGNATLLNGRLSEIDKTQLSKISELADFAFGISLIADDNILPYIEACTQATILYIIRYNYMGFTAEQLGEAMSTTVTRFRTPRNNPQFTGTLEGFVAAQRLKGRTTGSIAWQASGEVAGSVTFDGEPTGAIDTTLSWTDTTITYNGKTINA